MAHGFNVFDDRSEVQSNPVLREMQKKDLLEYVPQLDHVRTHLLPEFTFVLDERIWGTHPSGYHTTNVVLHGINAMLLFFLLMLITNSTPASFFAALLFAIHPVHVESVAWISSRKDLLYGLFMLGGITAYVWYVQHRRQKRWLLVAAMCYGFGILSRGSAIILPVLLIAVEILLGKNELLASAKKKALFGSAAVIAISLLLLSNVKLHPMGSIAGYDVFAQAALNFYALGRYVAAFFYPMPLAVMHPFPAAAVFPAVTDYAIMLLPLLPLLALLIPRVPSNLPVFFFIFFITAAATKLPVLVPVESIFTERFTYLPYMAFYVAIAYVLAKKLFVPANRRWVWYGTAAVIMVWAAALGTFAHNRVPVWADDEKLYEDVLAKYPGHLPAMDRLAEIVFYRGQLPRAIALLDTVLWQQPANADLLCKRGRAYMWLKDYGRAVEDFNSSVKADTALTYAYFNRGISYDRLGMPERGVADFTKCIALEPSRGQHYYYRALLRTKTSDSTGAADDLRTAERLGYVK